MVACPFEANSQCHLFSGPWPEQLTGLVKLWLKPADGHPEPVHLEMTCSFFPFTIYKNFTKVTWGAPPRSTLTADPSCQNTTAPSAVPMPRTRSEAVATRQLGPYTNILRRALAAGSL